MIRESIKIHDNYQFELKQTYNLSLDEKRKNSYFVQTYFFIPNNLNINRETYTREDFYKDLRATVRLTTPSILLKTLEADSAIMKTMRQSIEELIKKNRNRQSIANYEYQVKVFCLIYKKSMKIQLGFIRKSHRKREMEHLVEEYIAGVTALTGRFREFKSLVHGGKMPRDLRTVYLFADEYMSLKTETHTCRLMEILGETDPLILKEFRSRLMKIIRAESAYRRSNEYPSIPSELGDNESYVFHQGALKKYLSNILFLDTSVQKGGLFLEQAIYSVAAGIAMVFATMVAFIGQSRYGGLSLPFFIALVISYMFKDRIKELLRLYLSVTFRAWLYDRRRNIYHSFDRKIVTCSESFNIIDNGKVPDEILAYRRRDRITDINNSMTSENVILYRKYIRLSSKNFRKIKKRYSTNDVIDIMRFNVQNFLRSMDNPEKKIFITTPGGYRKSLGKRVYHINIITHFLSERRDHFRRFRLVLNRDGIRRIEEVL
jgi:hypothetical protein